MAGIVGLALICTIIYLVFIKGNKGSDDSKDGAVQSMSKPPHAPHHQQPYHMQPSAASNEEAVRDVALAPHTSTGAQATHHFAGCYSRCSNTSCACQ